MDCQRVRESLYLFIDQEMTDDETGPFQAHMDGCPHCNQRLGFTRKFLLLVRERTIRLAAPARLRQRILINLPHRADGGSRVEGF